MGCWSKQLDKKHGSRPRCVLLVDGGKEEVAARLTQLVGLDDVKVTSCDTWKPWGKPVKKENGLWDDTPSKEASRNGLTELLSGCYEKKRSTVIGKQLRYWWNPYNGRTPIWDIASTCRIQGKSGLLLVEAKAHKNELDSSGKPFEKEKASCNAQLNHRQIGYAIAEADAGLRSITGRPWQLSRDDHYQLSNRFAWSWKLATLGIPVVLLYLGFLDAEEMAYDGPLFQSEKDWKRILKDHSRSVVDQNCWGKWLDVNCVPLVPLIRACDQPFQPCED